MNRRSYYEKNFPVKLRQHTPGFPKFGYYLSTDLGYVFDFVNNRDIAVTDVKAMRLSRSDKGDHLSRIRIEVMTQAAYYAKFIRECACRRCRARAVQHIMAGVAKPSEYPHDIFKGDVA